MGKGRRGATPPQSFRKRVAMRDRRTLLQLVTAAGASPGVRHRWSSVAYLFDLAVRIKRNGGRSVELGELQTLLDGCRRDEPRIVGMEDFIPNDPRDVVLARVGADALRLFPGSVERPVADVARWALVAQAVDPVLVPRLGFGVSHYTELALRYADHAIAVMAPSWPSDYLPADGSVSLSARELVAARHLLDGPLPTSLLHSVELQAACEWATAESLPFDLTHPQSSFGRYLAVALPDTGSLSPRFWLPPALLPEATGYGVVELSQQVAEDPEVAKRFAQVAADRLRRALWRFADEVVGPPDLPDGPRVSHRDVVQWVARCGERRAIAVQLVARMVPVSPPFNGPPAAVRASRAARQYPDRPLRIEMPNGIAHLEPGVEVVPLLVFASAGHIAPRQIRGAAIMSLDDLIWASTTADYETDLFMFCRELANPNRPEVFAFEAINIWEWWRANDKVLHSGATKPRLLSIEPHWGNAEWTRSARRAELERALAVLKLPPIQDWVDVDDLDSGPPAVYGWSSAASPLAGHPDVAEHTSSTGRPDPSGWQIHTSRVPVAIRCMQPQWRGRERELLNSLAGAFAFGLEQIRETWLIAHADTRVRGYVVDLEPQPAADQPKAGSGDRHPIAVVAVEPLSDAAPSVMAGRFVVDCDTLAEATNADITATRQAMALSMQRLVEAAGVDGTSAEAMRQVWEAAKPTLAVEIKQSPTALPALPTPWPLDEALINAADHAVARAVRARGIKPGTYTGAEAKLLDRDVLAPAALALLTQQLERHALDDLLTVGMRQLDRAIAAKQRAAADIQRARRMKLSWDPVARAEALELEHLRLRRCCETAVEAALRTGPAGSAPVDQVAWMEIIAAAWTYLEATNRSEAVHHQLSPTALTITDTFEIKATQDATAADPSGNGEAGAKRVYTLDVDAYQHARTRHLLGPSAAQDADAPTVDDEASDAVDRAGAVASDLDAAMRAAFGASATDTLTVLLALAHCPLATGDDHIVTTTKADAVRLVCGTTTLGDETDGRQRAGAAVSMLTSTAATLQAADWRPWHARSRQRRLLIQPIVECPDGSIIVAPHLCYAVMTVYMNYLQQGMLPWSQPPPPDAVATALERVRDRRNKALELEVAATLTTAGFTVRERVKEHDPHRLGVPSLSGEIDAVAGRAPSRVIWLLEVKDPADIYVTPEIRRHLDTFYIGHRRSPAYVTQIQRKLYDLAPHAAEVAAAIGLPPALNGEAYEVRPLFVTRRPVPAAFIGAQIPFATMEELPAYLKREARHDA